MTCFRPLVGYRSIDKSKTGKYPISFSKKSGYSDLQQTINCGQCIGCRLERSRQWAVRCVHESKLHIMNCFITLTYDEDHYPSDHSLSVRDFQLFMKRLRKHFSDINIRYYACGEYGEQRNRPHYHAILFGIDFSDKFLYSDGPNPTYFSPLLMKIWGKGLCVIGTVTFDSAAYVARYVTKKFLGGDVDAKKNHYRFVDPSTGEVFDVLPEFNLMSRRPGIGSGFYEKFVNDIYPRDFVRINGKKIKPPRFYDSKFEKSYPESFKKIKFDRRPDPTDLQFLANNTWERLKVREQVKELTLKQLRSSL